MYSTPSKRISNGWTSSLSTTSAICWQRSNSVTLRWTHTISFHARRQSGHGRLFLCNLCNLDCSVLSIQGIHPTCSQTPERYYSCSLPAQRGLGLEEQRFCSQIHRMPWISHLNDQFPHVKYKGKVICSKLFCKVFLLLYVEYPAWHPVINMVLIDMQLCSLSLLGQITVVPQGSWQLSLTAG